MATGTKLLYPDSLVQTLDAVNEALFAGRAIPQAQRRQVVAFLASRMLGTEDRMHNGSYRGMPAPTPKDFRTGGKLFTGESVGSSAGLACKFGFEACRAMVLLDGGKKTLGAVLETTAWMEENQKTYARLGRPMGTYCCTSCSGALWRLAAIGGVPKADRLLADAMKTLSANRSGKGRWGHWPFYYTLLALSECDVPAARKELQYAAPRCEQLVTRLDDRSQYSVRRKRLMERVLAEV